MHTDKKRRNTQTRMAPGVLIVVFLLIIIWLSAGRIWKNDGDETAATDASAGQTAVGETLTAGARENLPQTPSPEEEAPDGIDPPGDPLGQEGGLPDDGAGAAVRLKSSSQAPEGEDFSLGIDVSKWQGRIDWEKVAASGVDFAIIRVGFRTTDTGEIFADPYAAYNLEHASQAGILVGAYFFSTAVNAEEAVEEASWTAAFLSGYPVTYPVAYNCEGFLSPDSRMYGCSIEERTQNALAFLQTIQDAGYEPLFHASRHDLTDGVSWDTAQIDARFPVWVAQYPSSPYPDTKASSYDGAHTMWQYTSQGAVDGVPVYTDLNVAYFSYGQAAAPKDPGAAAPAGDVPVDGAFHEVNEPVTAKEVTNLRTEPSAVADDTIAASLSHGEWITRTGISSRGWSRVEYGGQTLYAITSLLLTEQEAELYAAQASPRTDDSVYQAVSDSVTAKKETNLRDAASTENTQVIATIKNGEWIARTGIGTNGWSRLTYNGQTVYALTSYLTTEENFNPEDISGRNIVWTPSERAMTAKEETNLRDKPTTENGSQVIATIYNGDLVTQTAVGSNGWSRVVYEGQTLYAVSSFLTDYTE